MLNFISDHTVEKHGFKIQYKAGECSFNCMKRYIIKIFLKAYMWTIAFLKLTFDYIFNIKVNPSAAIATIATVQSTKISTMAATPSMGGGRYA